jgi:WD40 repeat protein
VAVDATVLLFPGARRERPQPSPASTAGAALGQRYEVHGELARGGMGVILAGLDPTIRRELVIKVLQEDVAGSSEAHARFVEEAQIQGQLEHPGICPVHELGVDAQGRPFFTMKEVKGRSLQQILDAPSNDSLRSLLEVFVKVCDAVAFAHARGVVHRDLKPDNIMIGEFGEVLVMDWGIAKLLHRGPEAAVHTDRRSGNVHVTGAGRVLGTPGYMPPEQALGDVDSIDERSDVYALGGVLYAILTRLAPLEASAETLARGLRGEIVPPCRRAPGRRIPADLDAATMKALALRPEGRYQSVLALRDDVAAFLEGRTLRAARYSALSLLRKWMARNQVFTLTAAAAGLVLLVGAVVYLVQLQRAQRRTELALADELVARADALGPAGRWVEARQEYHDARAAFARLGTANPAVEMGLLDTYHHAPPPLVTMAVGPGETETVALSASGRTAVAGGQHGLTMWDVSTGTRLRGFGTDRPVRSAVLSGDSRHVLAGNEDGTATLWDAAQGRILEVLAGHRGPVLRVALSDDATRALTASADRTARLWDLATGRELANLPYDEPGVEVTAALSADGLTAVTNAGLTKLQAWDLPAGRRGHYLDATGPISSLALTPDGRFVIAGLADGSLRLVDLPSGDVQLLSFAPRSGIMALAVSADGHLVLSGARDGSLRLTDLSQSPETVAFAGHQGAVTAVAMSADATLAISSGADGTLQAWQLGQDPSRSLLSYSRSGVSAVALSPDGRMALTGDGFGRALLLDVATGKRLQAGQKESFRQLAVTAFSPDGRLAVWGGGKGRDPDLRLWELATGRILHSFPAADLALHVAFSPDGRHLLAPGRHGTVKLWDVASGREEQSWSRSDQQIMSVAMSPDGRLGVSGAQDGTMTLWELASSRTIREWEGHHGWMDVEFSGDGRSVLSGGQDTLVKLWSADTGAELATLRGHSGDVWSVGFFPGSGLVASSAWDGTVRVWDLASQRQVHTFETVGGHRGNMLALAPDGRLALVAIKGTRHGAVGLYDFHLPSLYADYQSRLAGAREALQRRPDDPGALATFGQWYAFRGVLGWAADFFERARRGGAQVSPLELGRVYWRQGDLAGAQRELEAALARQEAPADYLRLCLTAIDGERRSPPAPTRLAGGPDSKIESLTVLDTEAGARWTLRRDLRPGDQAYAERETKIDEVDPRLQGLEWLRPAEMSKGFLSPPLARLTLRRAAELYIASETVALPRWLQKDWENSDMSMTVGGHPYRVFRKRFPAGTVDLGTYEFLDGAMYIVIVR